ncbi:hypothetical protein BB561_003488 [Smittium simulii]|uniref:Uncharacterized protein n=1 Tax=Smittium simulii TaxID=133385 RepID=A0A2T9YL85_9FUNG|nr:hypothetical protein BB561_003488 [Smittium simulii]
MVRLRQKLSLTGLNKKTAIAKNCDYRKCSDLRTWISARRYAKCESIEKKIIEGCPFCKKIAFETIEHMLLKCSRWQALQADILAKCIDIYRAQAAKKHFFY